MNQPSRRSLLKCLPVFGGLPAVTVNRPAISDSMRFLDERRKSRVITFNAKHVGGCEHGVFKKMEACRECSGEDCAQWILHKYEVPIKSVRHDFMKAKCGDVINVYGHDVAVEAVCTDGCGRWFLKVARFERVPNLEVLEPQDLADKFLKEATARFAGLE